MYLGSFVCFIWQNLSYLIIVFLYERVYLPLYTVADTPFHIQRDVILMLICACDKVKNADLLADITNIPVFREY